MRPWHGELAAVAQWISGQRLTVNPGPQWTFTRLPAVLKCPDSFGKSSTLMGIPTAGESNDVQIDAQSTDADTSSPHDHREVSSNPR